MSELNVKRNRGRPRNFDSAQALKNALDVFIRKGYQDASLEDLTAAMNINKPSMYAAFGNKEQLFSKVLESYFSGPNAFIREVLKTPTTRELVEQFLLKSIELLYSHDEPQGCLAVMSSVSSELERVGIRQGLIKGLKDLQDKLEERFRIAKEQGELPNDVDPSALATYVTTIHKGISIQASNGVEKAELLKLVDQVLTFWPANTQYAN